MKTELLKAIAHFGSPELLASAAGVGRYAVDKWKAREWRVPAHRATVIQEKSGGAIKADRLMKPTRSGAG